MEQSSKNPLLNHKIQKIVDAVDSILIIGGELELHKKHDNIKLATLSDVDTYQVNGQYELVLLNNILSDLDITKAEQLIAQIRDQHSKQLLTLQLETSNWQTTNYIQMGMRQIAKRDATTNTPEIWYFSLDTYKQVPDWLNNRFWANPELFDKYRW